MTSLPSRERIRQWIEEHPGESSAREIARAFGVKGAARVELRRLLRGMEGDDLPARRARRREERHEMPPVALLRILGPDASGDLFAEPAERQVMERAPGRILVVARPHDPALGPGERILARISPSGTADPAFEARLIRRLPADERRILGIFRSGTEGGRVVPVDRGPAREWRIPRGRDQGAEDGELVEIEAVPGQHGGVPRARILARLGDAMAPRAVSLIAIRQYDIPDRFSPEALAEAAALTPAGPEGREDLRALPFVTIDPEDARDRDDAVAALPDEEPGNPGGHVIWVAIADVAHYVRPGSALDSDALERGNSTYFPDRVVPMLPEALSGDLCSLHEGVDRAAIAARIRIDAGGQRITHRFCRAIIRSRAALAYEQVQHAADGEAGAVGPELHAEVIGPLYAAWRALRRARALRQPLDLDLPERHVILSDAGQVESVAFRERLDSHRLIEDFMVLANEAAALELEGLGQRFIYRIHEPPDPERIEALREIAEAAGLSLARGQVVTTRVLNTLLARAEGGDSDDLINLATLRAMAQACYSTRNAGHFGLALRHYAHFTSPIRRYADLTVHRALIRAHRWGDDGLGDAEAARLEETARQISLTERRSIEAERDTNDRYLALWLSERLGAVFPGRITGVQRFGLFVRLDESGADGLVPVRTIGREFFHFDPASRTLMGADTGLMLGVGQRVSVRLAEAAPESGALVLELVGIEGGTLPSGREARKRGTRHRPSPVRPAPRTRR